MASGDYTLIRLAESECIYGGTLRRLRSALGATAFGLQLVELPAHFDAYPPHDHSDDGQEEVYLALEGRAVIRVGDQTLPLERGLAVRVGPGTMRKLETVDSPAQLLVIGGVPGAVYHAAAWTEEGAPDPGAGG
jgi:mannose-6-phosphate isomerase-like protein (cupin superfamily)